MASLEPQRYHVQKVDDPTGKHQHCRYFVLDPVHDPFARVALRAYGDVCKDGALARDLYEMAEQAARQQVSPTKTVEIPGSNEHNGYHSIRVTLPWVCPRCGGPRGEVHRAISFDGSQRLECDGWSNPCGHVDYYESVRREAVRNQQVSDGAP